MVCSARLSCRSPLRLRRCRLVSPEDAGIGDGAGEGRERGLGPEPAWVRPADQHLRGADRSDPGQVEQFGSHRASTSGSISLSRSLASRRSVRMRWAVDRRTRTVMRCSMSRDGRGRNAAQ